MKQLSIFTVLFFLSLTNIFAQETARERLTEKSSLQNANSSARITARTEQMNRSQSADISDAKWTRTVYRYLDLAKEANAPLYYPVMPEKGRMNLFSMIFKLLSENKITAYEYLDGRELFEEQYKIDLEEFLNRFGIYHETQNGNIVVNDVDIPSNEVQGYYLKEVYYFETGTSNYGVKTLAICPILFRQGDYDASTTRYPLFWISYDELRPYTMRMPVMTSSLNNTMGGTIDDFFRKHNFNGEIYKTANLRNLAISQYTSTPEEMKAEQEKIEQQLTDFEGNLWRQSSGSPGETKAETQSVSSKKRRSRSKNAATSTTNTMRDRRY